MSRNREKTDKDAAIPHNEAAIPTLKDAISRRNKSLIGRVIQGKYKIIEPIAKGGMGQIYKAEQIILGRHVAIKVMHDLEQENLEKRFFLEASLHAKLEHPNTVRIFDFGRTKDRLIFIVMELLNGHTLKAEIDDGPMATKRIVHLAMQICGALNEAHKNDIVHRDIKPSNLFLVQHEETFAKLLDFGLVKSLSQSTSLSQAGMIMGSPMYMAPEQVEGKPIDARTDIYGLGMTLYQAICGQPPFKGELNQVLMAHILKMPPPFSVHLEESAINKNLEWIIFKAIQKDPKDRFSNISQMRQALKLCAEAMTEKKERSLEIKGKKVLSKIGAQAEIESLSQSQFSKLDPNQGMEDTIKPTSIAIKTSLPTWFPTFLIICAIITLFAAGMAGGVYLYERQLTKHMAEIKTPSHEANEKTESKGDDQGSDLSESIEKDTGDSTPIDADSNKAIPISITASRTAKVYEMVDGKRQPIKDCIETPCTVSLKTNETKTILLRRSRYIPRTIKIDGSQKNIAIKLIQKKSNVPTNPMDQPLRPKIFNDKED